MSYLTGEIRKQVTMMHTCHYNIEQMAKRAFEDALYKSGNPASDRNVALLNQIDNVVKLCEAVRNRCNEMETCLSLAEDMEVSDEDNKQGAVSEA